MTKRNIALALLVAAGAAILLTRFAPWETGNEATTARLAPQQTMAASAKGQGSDNNAGGSGVAPASLPPAMAAASAPGAFGASAPMAANSTPSSAVVVPAAGSPPEDAQAEEGADAEGENCEAHWPGCPCPQDLTPILAELHETPPKGMSLVEGSCARRGGIVEMGSFEFAGEMTIKGTIIYEAGDMFDSLTFAGYRVADDTSLHVPPLSENERCQAAPAEIKIKRYQILIGGTDEAGTWMRDYEVVKLGKYGKCGKRERRHR